VGQVTVVAEPRDLDLALSLAELADRPAGYLGLGQRLVAPLTLVVGRGVAADRLGRGRVPGWAAGWAAPEGRLVVVRADVPDPRQVLRHELAHLALRQAIRGRVPRWFDEGYAVLAAGEFARLDGLALNLAVARGDVPTLDRLNETLRASAGAADASYALAASAVAFLATRTADRSIVPLLERLADGQPFDSAVARATGLGPGRLEAAWQRHVRLRYNFVSWLAVGGLWVVVAVMVVVAWRLRAARDRPRRVALDEGWVVPPDDPGPAVELPSETDRQAGTNRAGTLDRSGR